jgi:hypothetical protein
MKPIIPWKLCEKEYVKVISPDDEKIRSIIKMNDVRLDIIKKIELNQDTAPIIAAEYYEVIKELLVSLLNKNGFKSDNHECLISFFRHRYPKYEYESGVIHQLKYVRNRAVYDGVFVDKNYIEANAMEFHHIINILKDLQKT